LENIINFLFAFAFFCNFTEIYLRYRISSKLCFRELV